MKMLYVPVVVWGENNKLYGTPVAAAFKSRENGKRFIENFDVESIFPGYEEGNREAQWNEDGFITIGKAIVPWCPVRYDVKCGDDIKDSYFPVDYGTGEYAAARAKEEAEITAAKARRYGVDAVVVEEILDVNISD